MAKQLKAAAIIWRKRCHLERGFVRLHLTFGASGWHPHVHFVIAGPMSPEWESIWSEVALGFGFNARSNGGGMHRKRFPARDLRSVASYVYTPPFDSQDPNALDRMQEAMQLLHGVRTGERFGKRHAPALADDQDHALVAKDPFEALREVRRAQKETRQRQAWVAFCKRSGLDAGSDIPPSFCATCFWAPEYAPCRECQARDEQRRKEEAEQQRAQKERLRRQAWVAWCDKHGQDPGQYIPPAFCAACLEAFEAHESVPCRECTARDKEREDYERRMQRLGYPRASVRMARALGIGASDDDENGAERGE